MTETRPRNALDEMNERVQGFIDQYCKDGVTPSLRLISDMAFALGCEIRPVMASDVKPISATDVIGWKQINITS